MLNLRLLLFCISCQRSLYNREQEISTKPRCKGSNPLRFAVHLFCVSSDEFFMSYQTCSLVFMQYETEILSFLSKLWTYLKTRKIREFFALSRMIMKNSQLPYKRVYINLRRKKRVLKFKTTSKKRIEKLNLLNKLIYRSFIHYFWKKQKEVNAKFLCDYESSIIAFNSSWSLAYLKWRMNDFFVNIFWLKHFCPIRKFIRFVDDPSELSHLSDF